MNKIISNPNPNTKFPVQNVDTVCYVKPLVKNPNVIDMIFFGTQMTQIRWIYTDFYLRKSAKSVSSVCQNQHLNKMIKN